MELTGKVIQILPLAQGVAKGTGNPWRKLEFVVETLDSTYPRKVCFELFGEKIDQNPVSVGVIATINFDINSREYNGRWYNQISAYRVVPSAGTAAQPQAVQAAPAIAAPVAATPTPTPMPAAPETASTDDGLPF